MTKINPFKNNTPKLQGGGKIPDLSDMSFAQAFSKSREDGLGQFMWNGNTFGNALNTKQELGEYDKKYNTNMSNIFTGSGIAGETVGNPQPVNGTEVQNNVSQPNSQGNPEVNTKTQMGNMVYDEYEGKMKPKLYSSNPFAKNTVPAKKQTAVKNPPLPSIKKQVQQKYAPSIDELKSVFGWDKESIEKAIKTGERFKDYGREYIITGISDDVDTSKGTPSYKYYYKYIPKGNVERKQGINPFKKYQDGGKPNLGNLDFLPSRNTSQMRKFEPFVDNSNFNSQVATNQTLGNYTPPFGQIGLPKQYSYDVTNPYNSTYIPEDGDFDPNIPAPTSAEIAKGLGNNINAQEDNTSNNGKRLSTYDKMFLGINTLNTVKGLMGRGIKPPKRDLVDRQDIIGATKGMNQYVKDTALQGMSNQLNTASQLNKTIDPRLNTASMLGLQENLNNSAIQLNAQDSQMYDQDVNRQLGQRQNENLRMLQNQQNFNQMVDSEALQNYQAQQANAQQSINQGMGNYLTMARDTENKQAQQLANDQLTKATLYQNAVGEVQGVIKNVTKNSDGTYSAQGYKDGKLFTQSFNTLEEANAFRNAQLTSNELTPVALNQANESYKGYNEFIKGFRQGGRIGNGSNTINPFKSSLQYTNELLRQSSMDGRQMSFLRNKTSLKPKFK